MPVELEIHEPPVEPVYFCPGEASPVSHAVHRARLAAHWPGCRNCPSQNEHSSEAVFAISRSHIRRTRWGVRGVWQNALTRLKAAQLIGLLTGHLLNQRQESSVTTENDDTTAGSEDRFGDSLNVVIGYDGRSSSPDIFSGVVSAALQNGCHVIDVGRSTVSAVQEACRSDAEVCLGIIVTGAGEASSVTGFDVFDDCGQSVSVPWQSWGVRLRQVTDSGSDRPLMDAQPIPAGEHPGHLQMAGNSTGASEVQRTAQNQQDSREVMARLKQSIQGNDYSVYPLTATEYQSGENVATLELPKLTSGAASRYRVSRHSGTCQSIDFELTFRQWLLKWFPESIDTRVACVCFDPLTVKRLEWLFTRIDIAADIVAGVTSRSSEAQLSQRIRETHAQWGICLAEDDRYITVANSQGCCLSAHQLSAWTNETIRTVRPHISTHVPSEEDRVVLLDAGRPTQAVAHDIISDGVVLMGCVSLIMHSGIPLPRLS